MSATAEQLAWYRGGDTGVSSETIFEVMTGVPVQRHGHPWDVADFGRCRRLLDRFPEWRPRLPEVAARFPEWAGLVEAWAELDALWDSEKHQDRLPRLYARIKWCVP